MPGGSSAARRTLVESQNLSDGCRTQPVEVRGSDQLLRAGRQGREERGTARAIEFAENVVEQQEGRRGKMVLQQPRRAELQRECDGPLLPLAGQRGGLAVEVQRQVVAMRPDGGLAQPRVVLARRRERGGEVFAAPRQELNAEFFARTTDRAVRRPDRLLQIAHQLPARLHDPRAGVEESLFESRDLAPARRGSFQQDIPRAQRPLVIVQGPPVRPIALRRHEIQKPAPAITAPAHQFDVAVPEPNQARDLQILPRGLLLHAVQRQLLPLAAEIKLQVPLPEIPIHHQPAPSVLDDVSQPGDPRRLQPQQNARSLQQRGLAARVRPHDEIHTRRKLRREPIEAAEVADFESGKHAPELIARHPGGKRTAQAPVTSPPLLPRPFWTTGVRTAHFPLSLSASTSHFPRVSEPAQNIVLIGFMGSGKSSVGRRVAAGLGFQFIDTDTLLAEREGREISEIFASDGEARFRDLESAALAALTKHSRCVISTGGGVILREKNHALLRQLGFVVWLTASEDAIFARVSRTDKRPLLRTANPRETVTQLFAARRPLYEAAAQFTVNTTHLSHAQAAVAVIAEARRVFSWDTAG